MQTNTLEEQSLAKDQAFRDKYDYRQMNVVEFHTIYFSYSIVDIYRRINGPRFVEINADVSMADVESRVFEVLEKTFPALCRWENQHYIYVLIVPVFGGLLMLSIINGC